MTGFQPRPAAQSGPIAGAQHRPAAGRQMMVRFDASSLPVLDSAVLDGLEDEIGDSGLVRRFAADYTAMWELRIGRLVAAVENQDRDAALDAAISLKVSSAMIGALRLARLAELLERTIHDGVPHDRETLLAMMSKSGASAVTKLRLRYADAN